MNTLRGNKCKIVSRVHNVKSQIYINNSAKTQKDFRGRMIFSFHFLIYFPPLTVSRFGFWLLS